MRTLLDTACTLGGTQAQAVPVTTVEAAVIVEITPTPSPVPSPTPEPTPDPAMEPFTIAWFGDTQSYASTLHEQFDQMVEWVVDNKEAYNIRYVVHTGDIVNEPRSDMEWSVAERALSRLSGSLPFFSIAGNHDLIGVLNKTGQDYTPYTALMEKLEQAGVEMRGWHDETWRRRYDLVTIGHEEFLFIGTGYQLSLSDYDWLNEIIQQHADRTVILLVHYYLDFDGVPREEGWHLYRKVVMQNPNVKYVLCGHRHRVQHVIQEVDPDMDRKTDWNVYALMNDYQGYENGGGGYIVLLAFDPKAREIRVMSYSPVLDDFNYFEDETIETYTLPYLQDNAG